MAQHRKEKKPNYFFRRFSVALIFVAVAVVAVQLLYIFSRDNVPANDPASQQEPDLLGPEDTEAPDEPEPSPQGSPQPADDPDDSWQLILVSAKSPLDAGFSPPQLENITDEYAVDARIADALREMIAGAKLEDVTLILASAYRDASRQGVLHNNQIERFKGMGQTDEQAVISASKVVLPPGQSEHHTGLAVDIVTPAYTTLDDGFADTIAAKWLYDNSWKYGFILRYPRDTTEITGVIFEPWHFRYVGRTHAAVIKENGLTLEEYLQKLTAVAVPDVSDEN